jgi:hypothetical protein
MGANFNPDRRNNSNIESLLRSAQLDLKKVSDANAKLTSELAAANANNARLQDIGDAFADICANDPKISRLCRKSSFR